MTEQELSEKLSGIKLVAMDIDGTYTDGTLYYDSHGDVIKGFHTHDGLALELLLIAGIKRGFITGRKDNATKARAQYLNVDFFLDSISDKYDALQTLLSQYRIAAAECAYIGDDLNDLAVFEFAGLSVAVANANREVKDRADYVTEKAGGSGAVREVVDMILKAKGLDPVEIWQTGRGMIGGQR